MPQLWSAVNHHFHMDPLFFFHHSQFVTSQIWHTNCASKIFGKNILKEYSSAHTIWLSLKHFDWNKIKSQFLMESKAKTNYISLVDIFFFIQCDNFQLKQYKRFASANSIIVVLIYIPRQLLRLTPNGKNSKCLLIL